MAIGRRTQLRSSQGEIVVHKLAPRHHQSGGGVVAKVLLVVDGGGDGSSAGQRITAVALPWLAYAVVVSGRKNSGGEFFILKLNQKMNCLK